ncbi:MAG: radical SAM family heme chaperone HemW [Clostridia bacterium]|nr:radical SAM family heme chaperone HemW [Clostridia bacterium]
MKKIGLYLHIPFCSSKCPYCDFYSMRSDDALREEYVAALIKNIRFSAEQYCCKADTLYIGGGTPSVLGKEKLYKIVCEAVSAFDVKDEITVECNPHGIEDGFFERLCEAGVNRISLGLQSANDAERKRLGRRADSEEITRVISSAKRAGINNISLDVMLGIPDSTPESLKATLDYCIDSDVTHISGYILKLEENTPFYKMRERLNLPDEDSVCDMYFFMCEYLSENGFSQYEISNFSKPGFESRHNLKYWNCDEYLGLGPSAHSFIGGERFFYPDSISDYLSAPAAEYEGRGGDFEEYVMLRLRLSEGIKEKEALNRFGISLDALRKKAERFADEGLLLCDTEGIRLTRKGFLLSNTVISELIY